MRNYWYFFSFRINTQLKRRKYDKYIKSFKKKFCNCRKIAEQYDVTVQDIYKKLKLPIFQEAVINIGTRGKRVDQDKFYEILTQYYK